MSTVDQPSRDRIRTDLTSTLFVEAGAGTGKTHELVRRVIGLIAAGQPVAETAAITFTEAAAAELRDRLREAFEKELATPSLEPAVPHLFEAALADLDTSAIGTLHAFCLRLIQEHPVEAGLPPRVDVLDDVSSQLRFERRWTTFVDELMADPDAETLVLLAWALDIKIEARRGSASFKDVAGTFSDSWDRLGPLAESPLGPIRTTSFEALRAPLAALRDALRECLDPDDRLLARARTVCCEADEVLGTADWLAALTLAKARADSWKANNVGRSANWPDVTAVKTSVADLGRVAREILAAATEEVLRHLSVRLARFTIQAAEARRAEGRLDYHDLLVFSRQLLHSSPRARAALRQRYSRLLLDEFQDTDPLQVDVAVLLASTVEGGDALQPWHDIDATSGRLFFVGDPKQSIYRFRRADIGLFLRARDRFGAGDPVLLRHNFRTVEPILDWVNGIFGALMHDEVPDRQPAYVPLSAARGTPEGSDHRVVVLGGETAGLAVDVRRAEADAVAATVATVRSDPTSWMVADEAPNSWRTPSWSDVTILIPTRTSLRELEDALDAVGVPFRVATGSLAFDTQEVREVLAALRAISDPGDAVAVVAALRSPLYACSDVDLASFRLAGGQWDYRNPGGAPKGHRVMVALDHLRSLSDQRWWREPSALLDRLLAERQAFALGFGARRPREVWRRLRFVVDQARAFEESQGGDLRAFVAWAELQQSEGSRVHEPLTSETDDDAVSIMTVHAAKGLEFPITVVSGATTAFAGRRRGPQVIWEGDVPAVRYSAKTTTEHFDRLADLESEMDEHERIRLLYVACTRARDHLVVSAFHKAGRLSNGRLVAEQAAALDGLMRPPPFWAGPERDRALTLPKTGGVAVPTDPAVWAAERQSLLAAAAEPRFRSATALAAEADVVDEPDPEPDGGAGDGPAPWRRGRAGTAIGRAVHAVLEHLDDPDDEAGRLVLAGRYAALEAMPDAIETISALARSAMHSPAVGAARVASRSWRELYVAAPVGSSAVEGYVDLLYETPDGLVLVDYKTDGVLGASDIDDKVERYRTQIAVYALALETSTGLIVTEARLVFCTTGEAVERVVPDLAGAKAEVRRRLGE